MFKKLKEKIEELSENSGHTLTSGPAEEEVTVFGDIMASDKDEEISMIRSKFHEYEVRRSQHDQKIEMLEKELSEMADSLREYKKNATSQSQNLKQELQVKEKENSQLKDQLKDLEKRLSSKSEELQKKTSELVSKICSEDEFSNRCKELEHQIVLLNRESGDLKKRIPELEQLLSSRSQDLSACQHLIEELKSDIETKKTEICDRDQKISELEKEIDNSREQSEINVPKPDLESELKASTEEVTHLRTLISDLTSEKKKLEEQSEKVVQLEQLLSSRQQDLSACHHLIEELKSDIQARKTEISERDQKISELEQGIYNSKKDIDIIKSDFESKLKASIEEIAHLRAQVSDLTSEKKSLEEQKEQVPRLEQLLSSRQQDLSSCHHLIEELKSDIEATKTEISNRDHIISKLEKEIDSLRKNIDTIKSDFESKLKTSTEEIARLQTQVSDLASEKNELERQKEQLLKKVEEKQNHEKIDEFDDNGWESSTMDPSDFLLKDKESTIDRLNEQIASLELKIREKDAEIDHLVNREGRTSEDKIIYEYKREINLLETELNEKNSALDGIHQHYQKLVEEKDNELRAMHKEFNSSSANEHSYQVKAMQRSLLQYQEENLRLKELLELCSKKEMTKDSSGCLNNVPEPTEFEYLRNIMFEFMMGREPMTLAKVIAAVLRFSDDQTEQVVKRQESTSIMPLGNR
ncbi:uncharacterized protein LOC141852357 [Brevipalpus obovatus]|uniref:uncharacterized protein LOC141852357 n=1 Tax=Brevipalpus obovatus TaxID=246614 RepID=UPI003D9EBAAC